MSWIKKGIATLRTFFAFENCESQCVKTVDLSKLKVVELKAMAKTKGLKGYTSLKKAQLVELLKKKQ